MKRDIKVLSTKSYPHCVRLNKLKEWTEPRGQVLVESSNFDHPSINLVILDLLLDRYGSIKIVVEVAEYWPTWEIILPLLGHQVLQIHAPVRFRKFLQGGTLSRAEWLPPNQSMRLRNLQDTCFFVSGSPIFVRQLWVGVINRDMMSVLISVESRFIKSRGRHGS